MPLSWKFLDTLNTTAFKALSVGALWLFTGIVWGGCAIFLKNPPTEWLLAWLGGLCGFSGVSAYQFKTQRDTDWEALRIKAGASVPASQTTVQAGAVLQQANVPPEAPG